MKYDKTWYDSLKKPSFQPPSWLFAPVWTILYALIGISFILIILEPFRVFNLLAYGLFFLQLVLNFAWTPAFFGKHKIKEAFFISIALLITTALMLVAFYQISHLACFILIPYLLWLGFASILNFSLWKLN